MEYQFISKTLFFPEKGILAVGDLHIGFEYQLQQSGVIVPENQTQEIISELKKIFAKIEKTNRIKKIIFLGDIKHSFSYQWKEKSYFNKILNFLKEKFSDKNIILIKGNHDTIDYSFADKLKDYHIEDNIAFVHGHKLFPEIFSEKIKTIVMGHIHPSVILSDKPKIKREKFKCFLTGKFKNKNIIIMPSFLSTVEGQTINEYSEGYKDDFSIIPKKNLLNFRIHVVGENKVYQFGKIKNLN